MKLGSVFLVMAFLTAATVGAQDLGQMAQKEKAKREAKEASAKAAKPGAKAPEAKVYTGDDLAGYAPKAAPAAATDEDGAPLPPPAEAAGAPAPSIQLPSDEAGSRATEDAAEQARQERSWRQRAQAARNAVTAAEKELAAAQKAKASLGIGPQVPDPELLARFSGQVREAEERVTRAEATLAVAQTNQVNLEEEARRAGALPGWLR